MEGVSPEAMAESPNTQTQEICDLAYEEIQLEFGIASAEIYLEQGCFEMPVLHAPDLLAAQRDGRSPFAPRSLPHLGLVAAAIPWLSNDLLVRYGYDDREEALHKTIETFDARTPFDTTPVMIVANIKDRKSSALLQNYHRW